MLQLTARIRSTIKSTKRFFIGIFCASVFLICLCQSKVTGICIDCDYLRPENLDLLSQRWINTFTAIHSNYSGKTRISYLQPVGYFQINSDNTYSRYSNGDYLKGNWYISSNCRLILDAGTQLQREFEIIKLQADTLIIRRQADNEIYIQHYKVIPKPLYVMLNKAKK